MSRIKTSPFFLFFSKAKDARILISPDGTTIQRLCVGMHNIFFNNFWVDDAVNEQRKSII